MKKIILSVLSFCLLFSPFLITLAGGIGTYQAIPTNYTIPNILAAIMAVANWLFSILLVVAVIGIVISGYLFVISSGDAGKTKTARDTAIYSLVGVVVAALGIVLVNWARNLFPN